MDLYPWVLVGLVLGSFAGHILRRSPFPPRSSAVSIIAVISLYLGVEIYSRISAYSPSALGLKTLRWVRLGYLLLALGLVILELTKRDIMNGHPIDVLMVDAQICHNRWAQQAKESKNIKEAIGVYRRRYNMWPPP